MESAQNRAKPPVADNQDSPSQEYQNFTEGLKHLFTVPRVELDRREAEWRANHPKSTVNKKDTKKQRSQPCG